MIVGKGAHNQYENVDIGDEIKVRDKSNRSRNIQLWRKCARIRDLGNLATSQGIFRRGARASSMIIQLEDSDCRMI